ncbi:hypothetical protein FN846DRAFT_916907 [Sphaerosporella brunnea]|uniref:Uncharacterized protein n=1 Tax=Sphaerosporella brunnea TaxID=1250544 RepID=A0A5J5F687_9PEZI|nr:hypothetical protein FN846DRAFT_916907 [Sphaerosporella brunnea]
MSEDEDESTRGLSCCNFSSFRYGGGSRSSPSSSEHELQTLPPQPQPEQRRRPGWLDRYSRRVRRRARDQDPESEPDEAQDPSGNAEGSGNAGTGDGRGGVPDNQNGQGDSTHRQGGNGNTPPSQSGGNHGSAGNGSNGNGHEGNAGDGNGERNGAHNTGNGSDDHDSDDHEPTNNGNGADANSSSEDQDEGEEGAGDGYQQHCHAPGLSENNNNTQQPNPLPVAQQPTPAPQPIPGEDVRPEVLREIALVLQQIDLRIARLPGNQNLGPTLAPFLGPELRRYMDDGNAARSGDNTSTSVTATGNVQNLATTDPPLDTGNPEAVDDDHLPLSRTNTHTSSGSHGANPRTDPDEGEVADDRAEEQKDTASHNGSTGDQDSEEEFSHHPDRQPLRTPEHRIAGSEALEDDSSQSPLISGEQVDEAEQSRAIMWQEPRGPRSDRPEVEDQPAGVHPSQYHTQTIRLTPSQFLVPDREEPTAVRNPVDSTAQPTRTTANESTPGNVDEPDPEWYV